MRLRLLPESSPLGWTPVAWLVYLSFFLVYAIWNNTPLDWLIDGPAVAAFLVLYFRGFWLQGRPLLAIVFAIVGIGIICALEIPAPVASSSLPLRSSVTSRGPRLRFGGCW